MDDFQPLDLQHLRQIHETHDAEVWGHRVEIQHYPEGT